MSASSETAPPHQQRAIVIGGSLAGLLAARVLSETFAEVLVVERDPLPEKAAPRKGTPHSLHPHGLLARGKQAIETLFPGFHDALLAQGAVSGDIGAAVAVEANRRRFAPVPLGTGGIAASRFAIEGELRRRVRKLPGVRFADSTAALPPVHEAGQVVGVPLRPADDDTSEPVVRKAALVADCTGRGSRAPIWLGAWGYEAPAQEAVEIDLAYTSAYFRRDGSASEAVAIIGTATPEQPRPYVRLAQEPDESGCPRWVVGLGGYADDHVEVSLEGMRRRAREVGSADILAVIEAGELIGSPIRYHFPRSLRRRYEALRAFPRGFLVIGDALASFNPIYGQGMTVAAAEALVLREELARGMDGLAPRFFKAAAKVVDIPWQLAVGGDLALPNVPGPRPFPIRLINAYVGKVMRAAPDDPNVAAAFVKVMHLLEPPASLFSPQVVWRTLTHRAGHGGARQA